MRVNGYRPASGAAFGLITTCALHLPAAHADYVLTPLSGGQSSLMVEPGESFTLDLVLTSDSGDDHLSSEFRLLFSQPGLIYEDYVWGAGYTTGGLDDVSVPALGGLPTLIDENSYGSPSEIDVYFSNLTNDGASFGQGVLVSLELMVPSDWCANCPLEIWAVPELFFDGFGAIPTSSGPAFTLIPAPGTLALLLGTLHLTGRRRQSPA